MHRLVLRHLSGSKSQQVDEIPIDQAKDILIGREHGARIQYDPDRDDLVGKQHARILQDPNDQFRFSIVDLNSRNGTFVNKQRVAGTTVLTPGDVIQFGPGGPELKFEIDPLPPNMVKTTREAAAAPAVKATREVGATPSTAPSPVKTGVGAATLERRIGEAKQEVRKSMGMWIGIAAVLLLAVVGYFIWSRPPAPPASTSMTTEQIAKQYSPASVFIDVGWKLVLNTGEQLYHQFEAEDGKPVPVFVTLDTPDKRLAPRLTTAASEGGRANQAISCSGSGSGFAVTTDGYIMTNRHVAANWEALYECFPNSGPAVVYAGDQRRVVPNIQSLDLMWVPSMDTRLVAGKPFVGQNVFMNVLFKQTRLPFPATLSRNSDRHDVSLIKISTPQPVTKVEMVDTYDSVAVGQPVVVMGYPAISPASVVKVDSADSGGGSRVSLVPDTTVTPGSIGRILRGDVNTKPGMVPRYWSLGGDSYQLTVNAQGLGSSGGPVFNDQGKVIGIFTSGARDPAGALITFAVPIRYALELMGTTPVTK